jgi:hypothetical protein
MLSRLAFLLLLGGAALASQVVEGRELRSIGLGGSYGFRDDIWVGGGPTGTTTFLRPLWSGLWTCANQFGSCVMEFRSDGLLSSTAADASANRTVDITGHAISVSGLVVTERVERSGFFLDFGEATTWSVGGEQVLDDVGTHAWEILIADASPNAKWLPITPYRFEGSSPTAEWLSAQQTAIPEASTWELIGVGFAALGCAAATAHARPG